MKSNRSETWQLQHAKNRFSELVDAAVADGPQVVTRRGEAVVVVVAIETWARVAPDRPSFKDYLRSAPIPEGFVVQRDPIDREPVDLS